MKKVVIVDDESSGRTLIKDYLKDYADLILVAEANNGVDAIKVINEFKPDLVFLDIQMPGLTGFEVLPHLEEIPKIIFSTAYDQYALKAFEVHAIDYLLKPYTKDRFNKAIEKAKLSDDHSNVETLAETLIMEHPTYPERILIQSAKKLVTISVKEILWVEADGDYSKLITKDNSYYSNYGISKLEEKLDPKVFIRVHRSSMVNIHFIKSVDKHISSYDVIMENGDVVRVSRGYMDNLKNLMY